MKKITLLLTTLLALAWQLHALATEVPVLQQRWAEIKYQQEGDAQEQAWRQLSEDARAAVQRAPDDLELRTWYGIIVSSYAGAKGGLGALSLAKEARDAFQRVIDTNPSTLHGSALTSLGVLYHKVPGWPLGFGDDDKARSLLIRGLKLNPDGIDSNFFYAEFLADEGETVQAIEQLHKAKAAPPRVDRPLADAGRQTEIDQLLAKLTKG